MKNFLECTSDVTCGIKLKPLVMTCKALYNVTPFWLSNFAPHCFWPHLSYGVVLSIFHFLRQVSDFTSKTLNMLVPGIFCPLLPWRIPIHTWVLLLDVYLCVVSSGPGLYPQAGPRAPLLVSEGTLLPGSAHIFLYPCSEAVSSHIGSALSHAKGAIWLMRWYRKCHAGIHTWKQLVLWSLFSCYVTGLTTLLHDVRSTALFPWMAVT